MCLFSEPCPVTCEAPTPPTHALDYGEHPKLSRDDCGCTYFDIVCDRRKCPQPLTCNSTSVLETTKGRCCLSYKCVEPPDKCIVTLGDEVVQLNLNEVFFSPTNPCEKFECVHDEQLNKSIATKTTQKCIEECSPPFDYVRKEGECCGSCIQKKCMLDDKFYAVGELWQSADKCMFYQCQESGNGLLEISEYSKSNCPKLPPNCPKHEIYIENCCQLCNATFEHLAAASESSDIVLSSNETDYLDTETYRRHPCVRDCEEGAEPMICQYKFVVGDVLRMNSTERG